MLRKFLVGAAVTLFAAMPMFASAQIVPCTGVDLVNPTAGIPTCQACDLVQLLNNALTWVVGVLAVVAAIFFVYAGWTLVTSAGNVSAKESAKRTITNTFIGFVIVLGAWLALDLAMKMLLSGGAGTLSAVSSGWGPWNTVQCFDQPGSIIVQPGVSLGTAGGSILSQNCPIVFPGPPLVFDCATASSTCAAGGGTPTIDTSNPTSHTVSCSYSASAYTGSCSPATGACDASDPRIVSAFGARAAEASIICSKESGGAPVNSGSDRCCGSGGCSGAPSFSGGYFQINVLAHASDLAAAGAPGCSPGFFNSNGSTIQGNCVERNARGICIGWSCEITDQTTYNACMAAARNPTYNFAVAGSLFSSRGFQPWANSANICGVSY